jgi:uncharacterized metal-binding protein YceD (DUF177 family)
MKHAEHLLPDALVRLDQLPADGREISFVADAEQRQLIAERLELSSVEKLEVNARAVPFRGGIRVEGRLQATIVQPCVITFVPVTQEIDEPIDRVLLPGSEKTYSGTPGAEIFIDLESDELPDHFEGGEADLSELIVETLSLAVDPYPHAPGATIEGLEGDPRTEEERPFAALKALKIKGNDGSSA